MVRQWYARAMRVTIDAAGRVVVPKRLRDELGLGAGTELDLEAVDGRLEMRVPSRVRVEDGPRGARFVSDTDATLGTEQVRELIERGRR